MRHGLEKTKRVPGADVDVSATLLEILKHEFVDLVEEINRILIFTAAETRGRPIGRVCLLGSIARWPGAEALLRELIDVPGNAAHAKLSDFFVDELQRKAAWADFLPEMAVVTGLALRGLVKHG